MKRLGEAARERDLAGLRIVVTGGGTAEPIDLVRVVTNRSTGKMGAALAQAAVQRGADVTLISSADDPTVLGVRFVAMSTVESLRRAVLAETAAADMLLMAAAVSDFRPARPVAHKIRKDAGANLLLELEPVADFMCETRPDLFRVGFAAETAATLPDARGKLERHAFEIICANPIDEPGSGFGTETNRLTLFFRDGGTTALPLMPKLDCAHAVLDYALDTFLQRR